MGDLIWVGNMLLPRWVVFVSPLVMLMLLWLVGALVLAWRRAQSEDARKKVE